MYSLKEFTENIGLWLGHEITIPETLKKCCLYWQYYLLFIEIANLLETLHSLIVNYHVQLSSLIIITKAAYSILGFLHLRPCYREDNGNKGLGFLKIKHAKKACMSKLRIHDCEKFEKWPFMKIVPRHVFPLYSITYKSRVLTTHWAPVGYIILVQWKMDGCVYA